MQINRFDLTLFFESALYSFSDVFEEPNGKTISDYARLLADDFMQEFCTDGDAIDALNCPNNLENRSYCGCTSCANYDFCVALHKLGYKH